MDDDPVGIWQILADSYQSMQFLAEFCAIFWPDYYFLPRRRTFPVWLPQFNHFSIRFLSVEKLSGRTFLMDSFVGVLLCNFFVSADECTLL